MLKSLSFPEMYFPLTGYRSSFYDCNTDFIFSFPPTRLVPFSPASLNYYKGAFFYWFPNDSSHPGTFGVNIPRTFRRKKKNSKYKIIFGRDVGVTKINDCRIVTDRLMSKNRKSKSKRSLLCLRLSYFLFFFEKGSVGNLRRAEVAGFKNEKRIFK